MNPLEAGLRQPDDLSCGAASVTMAAALADPAYAARVGDQAAFAGEVLRRHHELTGLRLGGRWQLPWPRALGTPPWAVARALTHLTGVRHRVRVVRWSRRPLPPTGAVFVGGRWLPRHVMLLVPDGRCYNPASGRVLAAGDPHLTRWPVRWFTVAPPAPRIRA